MIELHTQEPQITNGRLIMTETDVEKLSRIDERTLHIQNEVHRISSHLEDHYVTKGEFNPVKVVVYGLVGLILTGVIAALMMLII